MYTYKNKPGKEGGGVGGCCKQGASLPIKVLMGWGWGGGSVVSLG